MRNEVRETTNSMKDVKLRSSRRSSSSLYLLDRGEEPHDVKEAIRLYV